MVKFRSECLECLQNGWRMNSVVKRLKIAVVGCTAEEKQLVFDVFCKRILAISDELERCSH